MMYSFMTLGDDTEIVHSEILPDGQVKVYIEKPDETYGFRHAACWLPSYTWEDIYHFDSEDIKRFQSIIESTSHLILEFAQKGGFESATNANCRQVKCIKCGSATFDSTTTHVTDQDGSLIIIRNVPCHQCKECTEISYSGEVLKQLQNIISKSKAILPELLVIDYWKVTQSNIY